MFVDMLCKLEGWELFAKITRERKDALGSWLESNASDRRGLIAKRLIYEMNLSMKNLNVALNERANSMVDYLKNGGRA